MYHLVLTACLAADPGICAERLIGGTGAADLASCETALPYRETWAAAYPELVVSDARCVALSDLPALHLTPVAPGIWLHPGAPGMANAGNRGRIANLAVVIGETVTVIDPGGSRAEGEALYAAIAALTDLPVADVIITHMHPDHSLGATVFAEAGARITTGDGYARAIAARAATYLGPYADMTAPEDHIGGAIIAPDLEVIDRHEIGSLSLTKLPPAHTDNDLMVLDRATGTLFTGDLIFRDLTPSLEGSLTGWLAFLATAPGIEVTLIVPGHGAAASEWSELVPPVEGYLGLLRDATRRAIADGLSITETVPVVMAAMAPLRADWLDFDDTTERNILTAYQELEWE